MNTEHRIIYTKGGWRFVKCALCGSRYNAGRSIGHCSSTRYQNALMNDWWARHTKQESPEVVHVAESVIICPAIEPPRIVVKNLAQLKRALVVGAEFTITAHRRPELVGERRRVNSVDTTAMYTIVPGEPENEATKANHGRGSWLAFGKASFWKFDGDLCTRYDSDNTFTPEHIIMAFRLEGQV